MVVRISDKTQNYSKVTKLLVKPMDNYSNLKSEDKQIVQAQLLIFETVEDRITNSRGRVNRPLHKSKDNHKVCTYSSA